MDDLTRLDKENIWHPFTPLQGAAEAPVIVEGKGVYLYTADGRKIVDAISSWWVNLHGHGNTKIADAIAAQARRMEHVIFAGFTHEPAIRLSQNLLGILPHQRKIFFSDNGSTAVEVALKIAIQYWHNLGIEKKKVIAIKGAYHGDTFGSMSVAERGLFTKPFFPYLFETAFIDFPGPGNEKYVSDQFRDLLKQRDVAAFIFEPLVQAAGGMRIYSPSVLDQLMDDAQKAGVLCIADEVFTGFGRTGKLFASDYLKQKPDIVALSKGVTGGFLPLGVTATSGKIVEAFDTSRLEKTFFHGHSYTANPIACAAANASFDLLMSSDCQRRIGHIATQHIAFANSVKDNNKVRDVRTLGTILAIELETTEAGGYENSLRSKIYPYFLQKNILIRPLGNVLYVLPPYVIGKTDLQYVYETIEEFLRID
jgi:adenosylmethionine-8-amino-7-oxononanoate aminotransferase